MDTKNRGFLDLLPALFATLDSWRTAPPFPLLENGQYHCNVPESEYNGYIDYLSESLQDWEEIEIVTLFSDAAQSFSVYCALADAGIPESDPLRSDIARLAYQLCLNFRDAVQRLALHEDEEALHGFHLAVEIHFYTDPE